MQSGKSAAEKKYIQEITRLLKLWIQDSPLKTITFKTVQVRPLLLLQKPSKNSQSKDHLESLERRLKLWEEGHISNSLYEGRQLIKMKNDNNSEKGMNTEKISLKFKNMTSKGKRHRNA